MATRLIVLTGGIASGKSAAMRAFADAGVATLDTDQVARDVVTPGEPALTEIAEAFGASIIAADGHLNRPALGKRIFADAAAREELEAILHPRIRERCQRWLDAQSDDLALIAVPLAVESPAFQAMADVIVAIDVPEALQIERLQNRDGLDEEEAGQRLAAQSTRKQRLAIADYVLVNTGTLAELATKVQACIEAIRR